MQKKTKKIPYPKYPEKFDSSLRCLTQMGPYMTVPLFWFDLLGQNCVTISNKTSPTFGKTCVIILAYLWNRRDMYESQDKLTKNQMFWCRSNEITRKFGFTRKTIYSALKELEQRGFITVKLRSAPDNKMKQKVRWIRINQELVMNLISDKYLVSE